MNLLNYVAKHHIDLETVKELPQEEAELAKKINQYFERNKPLHRADVLNQFDITKHMFYKLKNANAIKVPTYMTTKQIRMSRCK